MSIRYDENTKARAVRLVREHRDDYESEWAAMKAVSGRLGMNPETLRKWVRQAEIDAGEAPGVSSEERRELRELRRKCRELESTVVIWAVGRKVWYPAVSGPLSAYAAGYVAWMRARSYSPSAISDRLWQFDQLSRWLDREGLGLPLVP